MLDLLARAGKTIHFYYSPAMATAFFNARQREWQAAGLEGSDPTIYIGTWKQELRAGADPAAALYQWCMETPDPVWNRELIGMHIIHR